MHFSFEYQTSKKYRSLSALHFKNRTPKKRQLFSLLSDEIKSLRQAQEQLTKKIREITLYFWSQMGKIISFLDKSAVSLQYQNEIPCLLTVKQKQQRETKEQPLELYDRYSKTSSIKQEILEEFKELKELEDKSNYLRETNQNLRKLRTSLSVDRITKSTSKLPPRQSLKKSLNNITNPTSMEIINKLKTQQTKISSYCQNKQSQRKRVRDFNPSKDVLAPRIFDQQNVQHYLNKKSQKMILRCPIGHKYYQGQTYNDVPHGHGCLFSCCNKNPIKTPHKFLSYEGFFKNGLFQGRGTLILKGSVKFEGTFRGGQRHGEGTIFLNGVGQRGYWEYDKLQF